MATKVATRKKMAKEVVVEEEEEEGAASRLGLWAILRGTERHQWEPLRVQLPLRVRSACPDSHQLGKK